MSISIGMEFNNPLANSSSSLGSRAKGSVRLGGSVEVVDSMMEAAAAVGAGKGVQTHIASPIRPPQPRRYVLHYVTMMTHTDSNPVDAY